MQIKYLKDAPLGKAGDIAKVTTTEANVLIRLGIAKAHTPRKRKKANSESDATDTDDNDSNTDNE